MSARGPMGLVAAIMAMTATQAVAQTLSPETFPSPQGSGAGNWSTAYAKARSMVATMTLEEMNNVTYGYAVDYNGCSGVSGAATRVGFPGLCLQDAGNGVRDTDGASSFASGISIGASWNSTMAYQRGRFMGAEFKRKGANVALGPVVGPIGRVATNGRNWEGFAADPYVDGILGAQTVRGMQENVIATVKHFVAYEQETNRNPTGLTPSTSANVDDKTMHELYLWPFQDLVYAGAGCVMCSYNRINGTYACENSKVMNGLLKNELNFQGFVVSDWGGQHSGLPSANGGLDLAMPASSYWDNGQLAKAVGNGQLNRTRLQDMATRIIATWYQMGQDDPKFPALGSGLPKQLLSPHIYVDAKDPAGRQSLFDQAVEGHVLVKNSNRALPLKEPKILSIFGYDAIAQGAFNPNPLTVAGNPLDSFSVNWQAIDLGLFQYIALAGNQQPPSPPQTLHGLLVTGGGSGSNTPQYLSSPYDAIVSRAVEHGTSLFSDFTSNNPNVVYNSDACLVFINEFASESWDRPSLADSSSDQLVKNVASKCRNTIVVVHNAGIRLVDAWSEHPNITAILFAHLPGQDAGKAVAAIIYGDVSPSGRLPYTVAQKASDYGNLLNPCSGTNAISPQCDFSEGVEIDYRSFLARNVTPRYAFGYGLTYSTFNYSNLQVSLNPVGQGNATANPAIGVGGVSSLFDSVGVISATIQNTGKVVAQEVAQLYMLLPGERTQALRGFQKVELQPGQSQAVAFNIRRKDVSTWDVVSQQWIVPKGSFKVYVGKSVLDTPLQASFEA